MIVGTLGSTTRSTSSAIGAPFGTLTTMVSGAIGAAGATGAAGAGGTTATPGARGATGGGGGSAATSCMAATGVAMARQRIIATAVQAEPDGRSRMLRSRIALTRRPSARADGAMLLAGTIWLPWAQLSRVSA